MSKIKRAKEILNEVLDYCEVAAFQVTGREIEITPSKGFYAGIYEDEEDDEIFVDVSVSDEDPALLGHKLIDLEQYGVEYDYGYFTSAFFHEIGHLFTMRAFTQEEVAAWDATMDREFEDSLEMLRAYKNLPHEKAADEWWLTVFLAENKVFIDNFDREIKEILAKFRNI